MKAQIEKLLTQNFESEEDFDKTVSEIQKLAEANPREWQEDLNAAVDKASEAQAEADRDYQDAAQDEAMAGTRSAELKPAEVNAYKARAWDTYWRRHTWLVIRDALYEQAQNVNFIVGEIEYKAQQAKPMSKETEAALFASEPEATPEQERQASNLSIICDYIRPLVASDDALLSAVIEQLSEWRRARDFDF